MVKVGFIFTRSSLDTPWYNEYVLGSNNPSLIESYNYHAGIVIEHTNGQFDFVNVSDTVQEALAYFPDEASFLVMDVLHDEDQRLIDFDAGMLQYCQDNDIIAEYVEHIDSTIPL